MFSRLSMAGAAAEATPGTPETLDASDYAMNIYDMQITDQTPVQEREQQGSANLNAGPIGAKLGQATFNVDMHGLGTTGAVPLWASVFLPACGFAVSGGTFTRSLDTSDQAPVTIEHRIDGIRKILVGAVGNVVFEIVNGEVGKANFTMVGKTWDENDASLLSPTYPTIIAPRGYDTFTLDSAAQNPNRITLDVGAQTKMLEGVNDAKKTGFRYGVVTDFRATLACDPDAVLIATKNRFGQLQASTEFAMSLVVGSASTYNRITFAASKAQFLERPHGNREKWLIEQQRLSINDGFTIAFD